MTAILTGAEFAAELERRKQQHKQIDDRRVRANARLEEAKRTHASLALEIKELFGTDDPVALEKMIADTEVKNHEKLQDYIKQLDAQLMQVEALEEALGIDPVAVRPTASRL